MADGLNMEDGLTLRGHHLLCMPGYQGFGYTEEHVAMMWELRGHLWAYYDTMVTVQDSPDVICHSCPHLSDDGCAIEQGSEVWVNRRDRRSLSLLGLKVGQRLTWGEVLDRIRERVDEDKLARACGQCRWFPRGHCLRGLRDVKSENV
ncbi:MAG: DUF1284 domain-containing protein [Dehalococcoidia bacterium]|jgi:hypothetical protein|nr:DUF1284 domain-containing protein [Dehalococcoidia bacterium]MDP7240849.1 DUF1284 domain-containing protein [Dehalococcoidia bacterium]